jgi:hypothetical protein
MDELTLLAVAEAINLGAVLNFVTGFSHCAFGKARSAVRDPANA